MPYLTKTVKPVGGRNSKESITIIHSVTLSYQIPTHTKNANGRFCINLPKIGLVPFVDNRPIPVGFKVKTGTVIREADGLYISFTIEDKTVPYEVAEIQPTEDNSCMY
ncbi:MAG: cytochrome c maturation protein CcmE [Okeania sp. SIO3B5]|uniref:hypothetical protein n=1 Tax=Okeania sp. SIO3B5 TaxID=2607811 RepID=UPI0014019968|nr:hypothetical protein [Okeania sp. SIO3B5]NEO51657.1 cytochrome c maturation protein CcmE [Okeania sp. SIO3B5]